MAIDDKKTSKQKNQNLVLENREKLQLTGIIDVISFNPESIIAESELGGLIIKGDDLRISKLNLDNAELIVEGLINSFTYNDVTDSKNKGMSFLARLFK